jgi:hypothetical protein
VSHWHLAKSVESENMAASHWRNDQEAVLACLDTMWATDLTSYQAQGWHSVTMLKCAEKVLPYGQRSCLLLPTWLWLWQSKRSLLT